MSKQSPSSFGAKLRELREAKGLSQEALAQLAGMHRFGIAKLERGEREPAWATVRTLAKALGVNCLAFDVGEEPDTEESPRAKGRPRKKDADSAEAASKTGRKRKESRG